MAAELPPTPDQPNIPSLVTALSPNHRVPNILQTTYEEHRIPSEHEGPSTSRPFFALWRAEGLGRALIYIRGLMQQDETVKNTTLAIARNAGALIAGFGAVYAADMLIGHRNTPGGHPEQRHFNRAARVLGVAALYSAGVVLLTTTSFWWEKKKVPEPIPNPDQVEGGEFFEPPTEFVANTNLSLYLEETATPIEQLPSLEFREELKRELLKMTEQSQKWPHPNPD